VRLLLDAGANKEAKCRVRVGRRVTAACLVFNRLL
jgi:hypothetical protein